MNRGVYVVSLVFIAVVVGVPLIAIGLDPQGSVRDLFRLGIDLEGGTSLIYELRPPSPEASPPDATQAKRVIMGRIDPTGTRGYVVRPIGKRRLEIILPGRRTQLQVVRVEPITEADLPKPGAEGPEELQRFVGGSRLVIRLKPPLYLDDVRNRVEEEIRQRMPLESPAWRVVGVEKAGDQYQQIAVWLAVSAEGKEALAQWEDLIQRALSTQRDVSRVKRLVKQAGFLEFRIVADRVKDRDKANFDRIQRLKEAGKPPDSPRFRWYPMRRGWELAADGALDAWNFVYVVDRETKTVEVLVDVGDGQDVTGSDMARAQADSQAGDPIVSFSMKPKAEARFARLTKKENYQRALAIILDDVIQSSPTLGGRRSKEEYRPLSKGGIIEGYRNNLNERDEVVTILNSGQLAASLGDPITERTVGPELGEDNIRKGVKALAVGLALVLVFMAVYYLFAGLVADLALALNLVLIICIMQWVGQAWTLPGIAGLILTIGMSVDANILIFERIREEKGREGSLSLALRRAYSRAFRTILDANITTLIPAFILLLPQLSTEEVKGFAIVIVVGILVSMGTALIITRLIFETAIGTGLVKQMAMLQIFRTPNINWMRLAKPAIVVSGVLVLAGAVAFYNRGDGKYDIEFTGGTQVELALQVPEGQTDVSIEEVRRRVTEALGPGATVQELQYERATIAAEEGQGAPRLDRFLVALATGVKVKADAIDARFLAVAEHRDPEHAARLAAFKDALLPETRFEVTMRPALNLADVEARLREEIGRAYPVEAPPWYVVGQVPDAELQSAVDVLTEVKWMDEEKVARWREMIQQGLSAGIQEHVKGRLTTVFADLRPESRAAMADVQASEITEDLIRSRLVGPASGAGGAADAGEGAAEATSVRYIPPAYRQYLGKVRLVARLDPPLTLPEVRRRLDVFVRDRYPSLVSPLLRVDGSEPAERQGEYRACEIWVAADFQGSRADVANPVFWTDVARLALGGEETFASTTAFEQTLAEEMWHKAVIAIVFSLIAIVLYMWFRFAKAGYGVAAVAALVHDVFITLGAVACSAAVAAWWTGNPLLITEMRINLPMVGAFLTLIGYSVNDTVVVFDRIRENRGKFGDLSVDVTNRSINQTLTRTIWTSLTTLVVVAVLYVLGGTASTIHGFAFVLTLGVLVGTYSSIAIASPILVLRGYLFKVYVWTFPILGVLLLGYYAAVYQPAAEFFGSWGGWAWAGGQGLWIVLATWALWAYAYGRPWAVLEKARPVAVVIAGLAVLAAPALVVFALITLAAPADHAAWAGPAAVRTLTIIPAAYALYRLVWGKRPEIRKN